ncbi:MAG: hypothetical protein Q8P67_04195 [archaeon]|nr:hypothetical protein [archaeon]
MAGIGPNRMSRDRALMRKTPETKGAGKEKGVPQRKREQQSLSFLFKAGGVWITGTFFSIFLKT